MTKTMVHVISIEVFYIFWAIMLMSRILPIRFRSAGCTSWP